MDRDVIEAHKAMMMAEVMPILESSYDEPSDVGIEWKENAVDGEDAIILELYVYEVETNEMVAWRTQKVVPLYE